MPSNHLCAAALSQLLLLDETGDLRAAIHAAHLLEQLSEDHATDAEMSALCERASQRLNQIENPGSPRYHIPISTRLARPEYRAPAEIDRQRTS